MPNRRILSLWFPRLGAERLLRMERGAFDAPLVVLRDTGQMQVISSLSEQAEAEGLTLGQPLRDAQAMCPHMITRLRNVAAEQAFMKVLTRWAGKFSPWVAVTEEDALVIDITGSAHLFGGEEGMLAQLREECMDLGLTVRAGIADTQGAAWALARFAAQPGPLVNAGIGMHRSGDDIDQEARATRSRAVKRRHWTRGGAAPAAASGVAEVGQIAPPGQSYSVLANLPVAGLRLEADTLAELARLGLRRIGDLIGQPRAGLARRFGKGLVLRLDQALGSVPEPVSPAPPETFYAVRMSLPDPIGLEEDMVAAVDRVLVPLCDRLRKKSKGARVVRLQVFRTDQTMQTLDIGLARATHDPERIRPLLRMKITEVDAGFGIDMLRLEAVRVEALYARHTAGHLEARQAANKRLNQGQALEDLIGRIGARVGLEQITRRHPASSHIPEKTTQVLHAVWSEPWTHPWPESTVRRPLLLWRPEPVFAPEVPRLTGAFRWRGRDLMPVATQGPERISPEWWLDEPEWRSGVRDYWRVTCVGGERLWLFFAHGGQMSAGWFCQGRFA